MRTLSNDFLSQSQLARRLDISHVRMGKAVREGKITPAFKLGKINAFSTEQIPQIVQTLANQVTHEG